MLKVKDGITQGAPVAADLALPSLLGGTSSLCLLPCTGPFFLMLPYNQMQWGVPQAHTSILYSVTKSKVKVLMSLVKSSLFCPPSSSTSLCTGFPWTNSEVCEVGGLINSRSKMTGFKSEFYDPQQLKFHSL